MKQFSTFKTVKDTVPTSPVHGNELIDCKICENADYNGNECPCPNEEQFHCENCKNIVGYDGYCGHCDAMETDCNLCDDFKMLEGYAGVPSMQCYQCNPI